MSAGDGLSTAGNHRSNWNFTFAIAAARLEQGLAHEPFIQFVHMLRLPGLHPCILASLRRGMICAAAESPAIARACERKPFVILPVSGCLFSGCINSISKSIDLSKEELFLMSTFNRRDFLRTGLGVSAILMSAGAGLDLYADPYGIPVGLQLYTVRKQMDSDFAGTLRKVASVGYTQVQFSGFHEQPVPKIKQLIDQIGLKTAAGHFAYELLNSNLSQVTDDAHTLGMSYVVLSSVPESYRHSLDNYKRAAEFFNKTGEGCRKAGLHFGYHNHNRDFEKFGDTIAF